MSNRYLVSILGVLLLIGNAQAQTELLTNPGFAMDLAGWSNLNNRPAQWDAADADNDPASGSALLTNVGTSNGGIPLALSQCIRVSAATEYGIGASARVAQGQPADTTAYVFAQTYQASDCSGNSIQSESIGSVAANWLSIGETLFTTNDTSSIRLSLGVGKPSGESADAAAYFDNVYLQRADGGGLINERLSGSWFNPGTPGQGFFLDISPEINLFFGGWFTWTEVPGQIDWMTVQGGYSGNMAMVPIYRSSGGAFNNAAPVTSEAIGLAEFTFDSCTSGQVRVEFVGNPNPIIIPLQWITPAFPSC